MSKKTLGQFYTTNYEYILQNLFIPSTIKRVVEPFAGNGDLLHFVKLFETEGMAIECYDIEPKKNFIRLQDTLLVPPNLDEAFVITNPPYLARNKSSDKTYFDMYDTNDLYKCFIKILIIAPKCQGGILIVPLNFFSSIRQSDVDLRKSFLEIYAVETMNIFEEQVFDDTSYTICSFQFRRRVINRSANLTITEETTCHIYPSKTTIYFCLEPENNYTIGGEIYQLSQNETYKIERATTETPPELLKNNFIVVKCLDDSLKNKIKLFITTEKEKYIDTTPNLSARSYALLIIRPEISLERQHHLVVQFNTFLEQKRTQYHSLFLTNYRESKHEMARKRISFNLVYELCNFLLSSQ